jgi:GNAT superfamily N-acetyltransferase
MSTSIKTASDVYVYDATAWCQHDQLVGHYGLDTKTLNRYNQLVRFLSPQHVDVSSTAFETLIAYDTELVTFMFLRDDLIGTAQASLIRPGNLPTVWIEKVVVYPDHRGQGLGRILMEETVKLAQVRFARDGMVRFCLTSRLERGTKNFYEQLGFTATPTVRYTK